MSTSTNITHTIDSTAPPLQLIGKDVRRKKVSVRVIKNLRTDPTVGTWWQPTPDMTDISYMFSSYGDPWISLKEIPYFDTSNIKIMSSMFDGCASLITIPEFNTSNVTSMAYMFRGCVALITVPLFNTINVTDMSGMFSQCFALATVPLFNTINVKSMNGMFSGSALLTTVPLFNTANVTNMSTMFASCSLLNKVPPFNAINVTSMLSMFSGCTSLTSIEMTGIKISFSIAQTAMQAPAINTLFTNLATIPANSQTVTVTGAPGAATCDRTIATGKGWIVA